MSVFKTKIKSRSGQTLLTVDVNYTLYRDREDVAMYGKIELDEMYLILSTADIEIIPTPDQLEEIWNNLEERLTD